MSNTAETTLDVIATAVAAAKARKAAKGSGTPAASAEERAAAKATRDEARAARKAERERAAATRKPPHLKKVEKALAGLPNLSEDLSQIYNSLVQVQTHDQLLALAGHLQQHVRLQRTLRATTSASRPTPGARVKIIGGDHRHVGREGTVTAAQRIRCYVQVDGRDKPVYLFTSDVEVL